MLLWFKKWKSNDTVDCAYTWTNKLMNKDGVDDAHRVIVAGPHTLLWLVSLNEALWRLERVFLLLGNHQEDCTAVLHLCKKD